MNKATNNSNNRYGEPSNGVESYQWSIPGEKINPGDVAVHERFAATVDRALVHMYTHAGRLVVRPSLEHAPVTAPIAAQAVQAEVQYQSLAPAESSPAQPEQTYGAMQDDATADSIDLHEESDYTVPEYIEASSAEIEAARKVVADSFRRQDPYAETGVN